MTDSRHQAIGGDVSRDTFMDDVSMEELGIMSPRARGLIMMIRSMGKATGNDLLNSLQATLTPEILFHPDISPWPNIWSELRKHLAKRDVPLIVHEKRRAAFTLANSIFLEMEEKQLALEMAKLALSAGNISDRRRVENGENASKSHGQYSQEKVAHNVAMRLKDGEQKFSGDLGQCWQDYVDNCNQIAIDYGLSPAQLLQYLHNLLSKDAHCFYLEQVKSSSVIYNDAIVLLEKEYNSIVRQTRVKNHLSTLRLNDYINSETEVAAALSIVHKRILSLSRQVPLSHRGDAHRIEFLRSAVIGFNWSKEALTQIATDHLTFQELYAELEIVVQLERESRATSIRNQIVIESDRTSTVHYAGQGRSEGVRHYKPSRPQYTKKRACFNCSSESHLVRDCPHPVSFSRAASSRIRELKGNRERNAAHIVLAHLCQELDSKTMNDVGENISDEDAEIFGSMLLSEHCTGKDINTIHVMTMSSPNFRHGNDVLSGACLDSGAQRTVIGQPQANAYMKIMGNEYETVQRCMSKTFRIGTSVHESVSAIKIRLPLGDDDFVEIFAHIIPIDVPLLIGLYIMKYLKIIIKFADSTLQSNDGKWKAPLVFKYEHIVGKTGNGRCSPFVAESQQ